MHQRPLQSTLRNRIRQLQAQQNGTSKKPGFSRTTLRRSRSTSAASEVPIAPGFIFDIDGVLKVGEKVLPQGREVRVCFQLHTLLYGLTPFCRH